MSIMIGFCYSSNIQTQARSRGGGQGGHLTPTQNGQSQRDRKIIHA